MVFKGAVGFSNQMICFVPLFFLPSQFLNSINELADQCCWQREQRKIYKIVGRCFKLFDLDGEERLSLVDIEKSIVEAHTFLFQGYCFKDVMHL